MQNTIGIIPAQGYKPKNKTSVKAAKWLRYRAERDNVFIQHAHNQGEKKIGKFVVDGWASTTNTVYEYQGCFWHGCPKCYNSYNINNVNLMTMGELLERTVDKKHALQSLGFNYIEVWECEFDRVIREDAGVKEIVDSVNVVDCIDPREAFYGGRTNAVKLFCQADQGQKIRYIDVCSLYPYVNKYKPYPLCHPTIITENFGPLSEYEGLVKCTILPPHGLYHPVLPYRSQGKLTFPLCRTCADTLQQSRCEHNDEERCMTGTWVTVELKKAVSKGYVIKQMHEVWHYDHVSEYNPITKTGGLFSDYINTFLKLKQEASGYPPECTTPQLKRDYIASYFTKEGIRLDPNQIKKNPGLRALSKLMLNSFWGKFGQRMNMTQSEYVTEVDEYFALLLNKSVDVTNVMFLTDDMVEVHYKHQSEFNECSDKTNVVIAAYTTAHARMVLYSAIEVLDRNVLYFDTDSIIFLDDGSAQTNAYLNTIMGI
ncbi:uncharacterized protein LOC106174630 [Lingula anatina]|uniref:DNA-directed DNA polymerase n=1 Tax=Lingula anatina TaxID=7574 RepID=A0A1S3JMY5_LINAN|nr:uncharacterized protein LOC106174630 [Lingula anatina]|eukprot:XP_013411740.1 uncharacterized protein LOC106174630 [Lingula anatina]